MNGQHSKDDRSRMLRSRAAWAVSALAAVTLLGAGFFTLTYVQTPWLVLALAAAAFGLAALIFVIFHHTARRERASEQWLATTLASIGDAVIATDHNGCVRFTNAVADELTGWTGGEMVGKPLKDVFRIESEHDGKVVENPAEAVLRTGSIVGLANHTVLVRRDGTRIPIEDSGAPIRDRNAQIQGVVVVFRDASRERAAQAALRSHAQELEHTLARLAQTEERLRLAAESAELGTWDLDLLTQRAVWDAKMYQIMEVDPGVELTLNIRRGSMHPEDLPRITQSLARARSERAQFHLEYRVIRKDSSIRWLSVRGRYLYDAEGSAVRLIGVARDVTEQRQLDERMRQAQKLDALGTLAGGIAHDFNNILTVMRGSLLVAESDLPADHPAYPAIAQINNAWVRARDLVRQILTFGRRQEQDRKVLPLGPAITEALDMLRSTLPASIQIHYAESAQGLPNTLIDASQVHQVITNLGINAAHAIGRKPGRISVALELVNLDADALLSASELPAGEYLRLSFSDTGPGMAPEVRDRIFEPFFTTKPQGQGTGLGLSVVRGIMKNHDGAITVYSQPGKGTQFRLYFPVVRSAASPLSVPTTTTKGSGERILYIDDELALVELAKHLLARLGYSVAGYADMHAAVDAFAAAPDRFDVVLTDLSMPGGSGLDVARQILAIRADVPILLASGYIRPEDAEEARRAGIREIIWKPFTAQDLGTVIARVLGERRAAQASAKR